MTFAKPFLGKDKQISAPSVLAVDLESLATASQTVAGGGIFGGATIGTFETRGGDRTLAGRELKPLAEFNKLFDIFKSRKAEVSGRRRQPGRAQTVLSSSSFEGI